MKLDNLFVHYGEAMAMEGVSLNVEEGELVCLLGPNGAGKTTLLNTICGLIRPTSGTVGFQGRDITGLSAAEIQKGGISQVPEGRKIFPSLTVRDNLRIGAYTRKDEAGIKEDLDRYVEMFPILKERQKQRGGSLSGGEQQIVAIVRALMGRPRLVLFDEPSLGLAPLFIKKVYEIIQTIYDQGTTILLVEQNARMALEISSRAMIMDGGRVVISGPAEEVADSEEVRKAYLGE